MVEAESVAHFSFGGRSAGSSRLWEIPAFLRQLHREELEVHRWLEICIAWEWNNGEAIHHFFAVCLHMKCCSSSISGIHEITVFNPFMNHVLHLFLPTQCNWHPAVF